MDAKPISQARLFGEINKRIQGQPWALVSAHGRRWREAIEVTEPAHGVGGGSGGASATACRRPSGRGPDTKAAVASAYVLLPMETF